MTIVVHLGSTPAVRAALIVLQSTPDEVTVVNQVEFKVKPELDLDAISTWANGIVNSFHRLTAEKEKPYYRAFGKAARWQ